MNTEDLIRWKRTVEEREKGRGNTQRYIRAHKSAGRPFDGEPDARALKKESRLKISLNYGSGSYGVCSFNYEIIYLVGKWNPTGTTGKILDDFNS